MFSTGDNPAARLRHELHTPLTSILAYTRLLRDDLAGAPAAEALSEGVACLDAIDRNAVRLQRYVDGVVLPLAATDPAGRPAAGAGDGPPRPGTTDLVAVLRDAVDLARRVAVAGAVSIHADAPATVLVAVDDLVCRHLVGQLVLWLATAAPSRAHIEIALRADPVPAIDAKIVAHGELTAPHPRPSDPQRPADLRVASAVANLCGGEVRLDETSFRLTLPASVLATASRLAP
ncbi:HAMP domain-containing histidine kinase [Dactylosporangium aurantiacum]|uniref:histidine kinase n=1 Tax=Dactylosporangium aurantiacum TaxID=35754 RepID=A0A9Q9ICA6_9ACTN|nr:histidine kinase dimerization/phospho-acceptor domain-containing protein [Dactylosporangium aurantiacum]MDG6102593.1 histidine kinase dimerization/phospho-acceptor domain-containing protein [Dactylosporangium aurantiacum]UWZ53146.1 HAMP domain-containing histidine kinase [Dactylosporangium aurantiacum]